MDKLKQQVTKDMTVGNPIQLILLFAVPLFIGNIFQQVYNIVDTMIAGYNLGDQGIAAIGATSTVYSLLICVVCGFNNGFGIVVSREFGAKNGKRLKQSIATMIVMNVGLGILLTVGFSLLLQPLLHLIHMPDEIWQDAYLYIGIIIWGLFAPILYNMCASFLRAVGNSKTPLYILILACGINVLLDLLFVVVLKTGVWGTALATVIAQFISVTMCLVFIRKNYREILPEKKDFKLNRYMVSDMFTSGLSMGLMMSVFSIGSVILQSGINQLGTNIITAHTAARRLIEIFMQPLSTIGVANSTFISQNWGGKKYDRIKDALKKVFCMEIIWAVIAMVIVLFVGRPLLYLLTGTDSQDVMNNALLNVRINCFLFAPLGILLALRTAMQAMGYKIAPVVASGIELAMKVGATYWIIPVYGYVGASITEPSTWLVCMVYLVLAFGIGQRKIKKIKLRI